MRRVVCALMRSSCFPHRDRFKYIAEALALCIGFYVLLRPGEMLALENSNLTFRKGNGKIVAFDKIRTAEFDTVESTFPTSCVSWDGVQIVLTWSGVLMSVMLWLLSIASSIACDRSLRRASATSEKEEVKKEQALMMKFSHDFLKRQCDARGLRVTGNKETLVNRLLNEVAAQKPPSDQQIHTLTQLERRLGMKLSSSSLSSRSVCEQRIRDLQELSLIHI